MAYFHASGIQTTRVKISISLTIKYLFVPFYFYTFSYTQFQKNVCTFYYKYFNIWQTYPLHVFAQNIQCISSVHIVYIQCIPCVHLVYIQSTSSVYLVYIMCISSVYLSPKCTTLHRDSVTVSYLVTNIYMYIKTFKKSQ